MQLDRHSCARYRAWIAEYGLEAAIYIAVLIIVIFEIGRPA